MENSNKDLMGQQNNLCCWD